MKLLVIFMLFALSANAAKIRPKISARLKESGITGNALLYFWRPDECVACVTGELVESLKWSAEQPSKVFFIFRNEREREGFRATIESAGYVPAPSAFVTEPDLFELAGRDKTLILIEGRHFYRFGADFQRSKIAAALSARGIKKIEQVESLKFPPINRSLYYDMLAIDSTVYCLSTETGKLLSRTGDGAAREQSLYEVVDKEFIFRKLELSADDSVLTRNNSFKGRLPGERFLDFISIVREPERSRNIIECVALIHYDHVLSEAEVKEMAAMAKKRKLRFDIQPGDLVETVRTKCALIGFDENLNMVDFVFVNDDYGAHSAMYHRPMMKLNDRLFANAFYFPEDVAATYRDSNRVFVAMTRDGSGYKADKLSSRQKPEWFSATRLFNDFSGLFPVSSAGKHWFVHQSYPSATNITSDTKIEMPLTEFNRLLSDNHIRYKKKNMPPGFVIGVLYDEDRPVLIYQLASPRKTYAIFFDAENRFLYCREEKQLEHEDFFYFMFEGKLSKLQDGEMLLYEVTFE